MYKELDFSITRSTLPAQVADRIQDLIESEALHAGDKLPPERDLAERLGVSRPVIREALQVLLVRGLIAVKPGCGTYIKEPSAKNAADYLELYFKLQHCPGSLRDFYEVRQLLETEAAGLAAERATAEDLQALQTAIAVMQAKRESLSDFISADLEFHLALARAAHNEYLLMILGPLASIWSQVIAISAQAPGAVEAGISFHQVIMEHLVLQDITGARESMRLHMHAALDFSVAVQKADDASVCCI
ncbi:MAG: FadR family transcriptional regulator [Chloroflexi bacterium]|nr:FadR family transcriptional regulator [Chloroflexota bacterium]